MSTYEISKSSLLSLKAEILRKQQELAKAKAENEVKIRQIKKNTPLDLKNKGIEQRQAQDLSEEEENLLKKSREALEAKTKLYDKLSKGASRLTDDEIEYCRRYLVKFDKKARVSDHYQEEEEEDDPICDNYEPPKNPDEEWVEYVDCLGRTRTCLRKDLEYLKSKDKDLKLIVDKRRNRDKSRSRSRSRSRTRYRSRSRSRSRPRNRTPSPEKGNRSPELTEENELLSPDMRREILRRQWEKEEEEIRNKSDIHYQDLLFNEARTHGVGYYGFSKDEETRAKQQEALKKLREETREKQKKSENLRAMREKQIAARVRAAMNRKRQRMGLPPLEDEPEPTPAPVEEAPQKQETNEKEKKLEEKRKKHVRPWDLGKEGVKEHYEYTQEEWVDKKRKERPNEFAPPKEYRKERKKMYDSDEESSKFKMRQTTKKSKPEPIVNELSDDENESRDRGKGAEVAPPPTYDYYGPGKSKKSQKRPEAPNVSDSIEAGLKFLREQMEKKQTTSRRSEDIFLS
ncbi:coiled-coil domain-containing protein 174 [Tribolium madens]|uniref:coiled-coil domain-containing protein 174 n=1 Tax=Tribolium madens TaxID=41895 RepID=UPI001CF75EFE|nr:coiled-coil domain-containing protein 174 [Tribolium madens]